MRASTFSGELRGKIVLDRHEVGRPKQIAGGSTAYLDLDLVHCLSYIRVQCRILYHIAALLYHIAAYATVTMCTTIPVDCYWCLSMQYDGCGTIAANLNIHGLQLFAEQYLTVSAFLRQPKLSPHGDAASCRVKCCELHPPSMPL